MRTPQLLAILSCLALLAPGAAPAAPESPVDLALDHLRSLQGPDGRIGDVAPTAWAAIAFARAGVDPSTVRVPGGTSLADAVVQGTTPALDGTSLTRQVLALAASGLDPRAAPGFDAIAAMRAHFDGTQYGEPTLVNDDVFALQALVAAGVPARDPMVQALRAFLAQTQQPSGAWSFGVVSPGNPDLAFALTFADVDTTAQAVVALLASGSGPSDAPVARAMLWIKGNQGLDGGCTWSPVDLAFDALFDPAHVLQSNTASTSWALMALHAAGQDPAGPAWTVPTGATMPGYLLSLQAADGSFLYQQDAPAGSTGFRVSLTSWIVVALTGHTFVA